ncbi:MAG: VCBS repeat-containing protein [Phycisphaeraceae bacterium]|nr:MAG: VCBS repeat-containing protein [Phycisphaeraceae bacterium]
MNQPQQALASLPIAAALAALSPITAAQPCPGLAFNNVAQELEFTTGVARSLKTGDLNGDGLIDAVLVGEGGVSLYYGQGDGLLADAVQIDAPIAPDRLRLEDIDLDGYDDLVMLGYGGYAILYGDGSGFTSQHIEVATNSIGVSGLAIADLNGDGIKDIVGSMLSLDRLSVLIGLGNRQFAPEISIPIYHPFGLGTGDFDGDGFDDLAVALEQDAQVLVLHGLGDGTFSETQRLSTPQHPNAVNVIDLDGDGLLDIVADNEFPPQGINISYGEPGGTFTVATHYDAEVNLFAGSDPPAVADLDGDGLLDIVSGAGLDGAAVLLGVDNRHFLVQREYAGRLVLAQSTVSADVNADGRSDVIVATWYAPFNGLIVVENICDQMCTGSDVAAPIGTQDLGDITTFVEMFTANDPIADLNRDDLVDLADIVAFIVGFGQGCP